MVVMEEKVSWYAPEYADQKKSTDWYIIITILGISIVATAIIVGQVLFALVLAVSIASFIIIAARKPQEIYTELSSEGIRINQNYYPYQGLVSFGIDVHTNPPKLVVKSKKIFMPYLIIPMDPHMLEVAHDFLLKHLEVANHEEPLFEKLLERIGF